MGVYRGHRWYVLCLSITWLARRAATFVWLCGHLYILIMFVELIFPSSYFQANRISYYIMTLSCVNMSSLNYERNWDENSNQFDQGYKFIFLLRYFANWEQPCIIWNERLLNESYVNVNDIITQIILIIRLLFTYVLTGKWTDQKRILLLGKWHNLGVGHLTVNQQVHHNHDYLLN